MMFSPGCKCCACNWTFTVTEACTGLAVPGTAISAKQAGVEIATCTVSGQVASVARVGGGSGYTNGSYTNGTFTGGGGSGGTFNYTVASGVIQSTLTVTNPGTGYTSAPTPVFNAGPGTGASATATIATKCTLNVPAGTYDVTVTPPAGSPYAASTSTIAHTCGQTTSIVLSVDGDHLCLTGCPCVTPPKIIEITFNFSGAYTGFHWPDGPLTRTGPGDPFTPNAWASAGFDGGGAPVALELICSPTPNLWDLRVVRTDEPGPHSSIGTASGLAPATCIPFANPNGVLSGASSHGSTWSILG